MRVNTKCTTIILSKFWFFCFCHYYHRAPIKWKELKLKKKQKNNTFQVKTIFVPHSVLRRPYDLLYSPQNHRGYIYNGIQVWINALLVSAMCSDDSCSSLQNFHVGVKTTPSLKCLVKRPVTNLSLFFECWYMTQTSSYCFDYTKSTWFEKSLWLSLPFLIIVYHQWYGSSSIWKSCCLLSKVTAWPGSQQIVILLQFLI